MIKKGLILAGMFALLLAAACKTKKSQTSASNSNPNTGSAATLLDVAKTKYPGITQADLDEGQQIFSTACIKCHGSKAPASRDENEWTHVMDKMAPKAKLNDTQKTKVLQYVLSVRAKELGK